MSIAQFIKENRIYAIDTADNVAGMGGWQPTSNYELHACHVHLLVVGTLASNITAQLKFFTTSDLRSAYATSTSVDLDDEASRIGSTANFIIRIPFFFNREFLSKEIIYYLGLSLSNYTRNADTFYIATIGDTVDPVYTATSTAASSSNKPSKKMIYGYQV